MDRKRQTNRQTRRQRDRSTYVSCQKNWQVNLHNWHMGERGEEEKPNFKSIFCINAVSQKFLLSPCYWKKCWVILFSHSFGDLKIWTELPYFWNDRQNQTDRYLALKLDTIKDIQYVGSRQSNRLVVSNQLSVSYGSIVT